MRLDWRGCVTAMGLGSLAAIPAFGQAEDDDAIELAQVPVVVHQAAQRAVRDARLTKAYPGG